MKKYTLDSNIYITAAQNAAFASELIRFSERFCRSCTCMRWWCRSCTSAERKVLSPLAGQVGMSQNPTAVPIQLPLALKPVVRSREGGRPDGSQLPYHPAIVIVDAAGRRVTDVASDPDDIRAGRVIMDPHRLVSRATQVVAWLEEVHGRISGWVEGLDDKASLIVRPVLSVDSSRRRVLAGVQFCSAPDDAFDHLTETLTLLAAGDELEKPLDALRLRTLRRHDAAVTLLAALQDAVHSWRSAEALTSGSGPVLGIDDSRLEP